MKLVAQILATFNEIDSHLTKIYDIAINANDSAAQQAIADKRVLTENAFFVLLWGQLENEINESVKGGSIPGRCGGVKPGQCSPAS